MSLLDQVNDLRRRRVPTPLLRSFTWYRALDAAQRYVVEERVALCVGTAAVTPEAWLLAQQDLQQHNQRKEA
ncbi:MAG TPA: hypothetical protein VGF13_01160 [Verrucomicrobiae bacterium]|jgi:hypothetical protein